MKQLLLFMLTLVSSCVFLSGCSKEDHAGSKTFVLVHGSFQAPFVWEAVKEGLEEEGQKVIVVELPGHGKDMSAPETASIDLYRDKVLSAINPVKGKVVLVGHSMGGMVITAVTERIPERIEKLVYIAGFVPANGQSLFDLASTDPTSLLGPALIPSDDHLTFDILPGNIAAIFCQDGSEQVKNLLIANRRAEPAIPFTNKALISPAHFGKADKYYIYTMQDKAIGINLQKRMTLAAGITKTYSLQSGHSPFLSKPDSVVSLLMNISR